MTLKEDIYCLLDWTEECIKTNDAHCFIEVAYNYIVNYLDMTTNKKVYKYLHFAKEKDQIYLQIMGVEMIIEHCKDEIIFIKKILNEKKIVARYNLVSEKHSIMDLDIVLFHPSYFLTILDEIYSDHLSSAANNIRLGKFYIYI